MPGHMGPHLKVHLNATCIVEVVTNRPCDNHVMYQIY